MNQIKIAAPLYIVRDEAAKDLMAVLGKLKALGFDGVEFLGFFGQTPEAIKQELDRISLKALGDHVPLDEFMADAQGVIAVHKQIGCEYLTIGIPHDTGLEQTAEIIKKLKYLCGLCYKEGIIPLYHNHDFEYRGPVSIADVILDQCAEEKLCFEPDLGWMAFMDIDPALALAKYKNRCPVLHLKDIYAKDMAKAAAAGDPGDQKGNPDHGCFEFRPVGYGVVDMPRLMPYCMDCKPEWLVIDHDNPYERSAYDDLKISLEYTNQLIKMQ